MLTLRQYQRDAIDAIYAYWQSGGGNPLVVLPTAAGKSFVAATLVRELIEQYHSLRICVVTHVKELIAQNYSELIRYWPEAPAGIYSAGIRRRDICSRILFCGIQSVHRRVSQLGGFDVLIVDEAHLIPRSSATMYGKFIDALRNEIPDMRVVGLTATPYRLDSGRLDKGYDKLFDKIAYEISVADLIEQGFISQLINKATATTLDVSGVGKRGGDYIPGQLEAAVNKDNVTQAAVEEIVRYGADRRAWLVFCAGVDHAHAVRDVIRTHGITCETVTGETKIGDRDRIIHAYRDGNIRCLTNVNVLTTGFNVPHVDLLAMLRPTQSAGLYVQSVGRAFRIAPGKSNALILDFSGNIKRHGPVDAVQIRDKLDGNIGNPLAKECPSCHTLVALAARSCPTCGFEWPAAEFKIKHESTADAESSILSCGAPEWIAVDSVRYYRHEKPASPPSLRVEYSCGLMKHREWVCLSHVGYARSKAESWWLRAAETQVPKSTDEAMTRLSELRAPLAIQVRPDGRFFQIVGRSFEKRMEAAE